MNRLFIFLTLITITIAAQEYSLPSDVFWNRITEMDNDVLLTGNKGNDLLIFSLSKKTVIKKLSGAGSSNALVKKSGVIVFSSDGNNSFARIFSKQGKMQKEIKLPPAIYLDFFSNNHKETYCAQVTLEDGGKFFTCIFRLSDMKQVMKMQIFQNIAEDSKLALPLLAVSEKFLILANRRKTSIEFYSLEGKKMFDIPGDIIEYKPYTKDELECLTEMERYYAIADKNHPDLYSKADCTESNELILFRKQRPGSSDLILDYYSIQKRSLIRSEKYSISENRILIDVHVIKNDIYFLMKTVNNETFIKRIIK